MKKVISVVTAIIMVIPILLVSIASAASDINITVSPLRESVILNPGDVYKSSFTVSNPGYSENELNYHVEVKPFYVDENYNPVFERSEDGDKQLMNDWITVTSGEKGTIEPNESVIVNYEIKVPNSAPAGGQYACISAIADATPGEIGSVNIAEGLAINHIVLAEITGKTIESGEILDAGVQSFKIGGKIMAYSRIANNGNVHGLATYSMKVYPLFSNEAVYDNEGKEDHYVLPEREYYNETVWEETPIMGIFNVDYTVEFQGMKSEIHRMVVVCPWWILFIVISGIIILIIRVISLVKLQKVAKVAASDKKADNS